MFPLLFRLPTAPSMKSTIKPRLIPGFLVRSSKVKERFGKLPTEPEAQRKNLLKEQLELNGKRHRRLFDFVHHKESQ